MIERLGPEIEQKQVWSSNFETHLSRVRISILRFGEKQGTSTEVTFQRKFKRFSLVSVDSDPLEKLAHRISCILEKDLKRQQPSKKKRNEDGTAEKSPSKVPTTSLKSFGKELDLDTVSIDDALR
jgi:hypothetical protein